MTNPQEIPKKQQSIDVTKKAEEEKKACIDETCKESNKLKNKVKTTEEEACIGNACTKRNALKNKVQNEVENNSANTIIPEKKIIEIKKNIDEVKKLAIEDVKKNPKITENITENITYYAEALLSKLTFEYQGTLDFTEESSTIADSLLTKVINTEDDGDIASIKSVIRVYFIDKINNYKKDKKGKEDGELASITIQNKNGEIVFLTTEEAEAEEKKAKQEQEKQKEKQQEAEKLENFPEWLKSDKNFRDALKNSAENQDKHQKDIKKYISEKPVLRFLEKQTGLSSYLLNSDSLIGLLFRFFFSDAPSLPADKPQNPLITLTDTEKEKAEGRATRHMDNLTDYLNEGDNQETYNNTTKEGKITRTLTQGFGLNRNNITSKTKTKRKETFHQMVITPQNKAQFTDIYSFLQSPNTTAENTFITKKITDIAKNKKMKGIGETTLGVMNTVNKYAKGEIGETVTSLFSSNNEEILGGKNYSRLKKNIGFPAGIKTRTTPKGNIIISWSEKKETAEERAEKELESKKIDPEEEKKFLESDIMIQLRKDIVADIPEGEDKTNISEFAKDLIIEIYRKFETLPEETAIQLILKFINKNGKEMEDKLTETVRTQLRKNLKNLDYTKIFTPFIEKHIPTNKQPEAFGLINDMKTNIRGLDPQSLIKEMGNTGKIIGKLSVQDPDGVEKIESHFAPTELALIQSGYNKDTDGPYPEFIEKVYKAKIKLTPEDYKMAAQAIVKNQQKKA